MDELFRLEDVTVTFGRNEVLKKFNLSIYARERIAICGPSGTGKSTLLRCLNLLQHIEQGTIYSADRRSSRRTMASPRSWSTRTFTAHGWAWCSRNSTPGPTRAF